MTYISAQVSKNKQNVIVWERDEHGNRDYRLFPAPYYFYIENSNGIYNDIYGKKLNKVNCSSYKEFYEIKEELTKKGMKLYESDIGPEYKILSEHYYNK